MEQHIRRFIQLLQLLTFIGQHVLPIMAGLYEDYEQCKASGHFGPGNGSSSSLACEPEGRLTPQALIQLNGMLTELAGDAGCKCADGCGGKSYSVRLLVTNAERVEQSGGLTALNDTAERIWHSEAMGSEQCDNGMLLLYIRDQKRMVIYQGHRTLQIFSDQDIDNLHQLTSRTNRSGEAEALTLLSTDAEAQRQTDDDENSAPIIGLSIALALTFFVLFCLLCILVVKCCSVCCCRQKRKTSKYNFNPMLMPNYKSIEPIYIVAPNGSEVAPFAPPSGASLYGTATFPHRRGRSFSPHAPPTMLLGHPPPPPNGGTLVHQPHSRSVTPTSTQRTRRMHDTGGEAQLSGKGGVQSMNSTPEPNKRDKVDRTMTVHSNGTYYTAGNANPSLVATKTFSHPQHSSTSTNRDLADDTPSSHSNSFPFLDPKRKQEVQTREEFIG